MYGVVHGHQSERVHIPDTFLNGRAETEKNNKNKKNARYDGGGELSPRGLLVDA